jgi:septum formation protein
VYSLILASASPRRRELLDAAGLAHFVDPVDVDERIAPGETPEAYAGRVARDKAQAGAHRHPAAHVLGADTIVVVDTAILGKPKDDGDAQRMLRLLSGRAHDVLTAVALAIPGRELATRIERTRVWFAALSDQDIEWYLSTGEHRDKAGAYAIQGRASRFIPRIEGSYANVVGLPVTTVFEMLKDSATAS